MTFGQPDDPAGDFFGQVMGSMMKFIGTSLSPQDPTDITKSIAVSIATEGKTESNVDPELRISMERIFKIAGIYLADMEVIDQPGADRLIEPVERGAWAIQTASDWRYLNQYDSKQNDNEPTPDTEQHTATNVPIDIDNIDSSTSSTLSPEEEKTLAKLEASLANSTDPFNHIADNMTDYMSQDPKSLMSAWSKIIGPTISAMQLGASIGALSQHELGQYGLLIPRVGSSKIMVIPRNMEIFAKDWSLGTDEVWLWVSLREILAHNVLSRPHVANKLISLLSTISAQVAQATMDAMQQVGDMLATGETDYFEQLMSDPLSLMNEPTSSQYGPAEAEIKTLNALITGYLDYELSVSVDRLFGGKTNIVEAWHRYQINEINQERGILGIDPDPDGEDRGKRFISGILERESDNILDLIWKNEDTLPTVAELDAPGLWLERLRIEGLL